MRCLIVKAAPVSSRTDERPVLSLLTGMVPRIELMLSMVLAEREVPDHRRGLHGQLGVF